MKFIKYENISNNKCTILNQLIFAGKFRREESIAKEEAFLDVVKAEMAEINLRKENAEDPAEWRRVSRNLIVAGQKKIIKHHNIHLGGNKGKNTRL